MPPPTMSLSTFSISDSSTVSLVDTFEPATMATSGRAGCASALARRVCCVFDSATAVVTVATAIVLILATVGVLQLTEIGWPTHRGGVSVRDQARYAVRALVMALSAGVERSFWYNLVSSGPDPAKREHNFGLVRHPDDPRGAVAFKFPAREAITTSDSVIGAQGAEAGAQASGLRVAPALARASRQRSRNRCC